MPLAKSVLYVSRNVNVADSNIGKKVAFERKIFTQKKKQLCSYFQLASFVSGSNPNQIFLCSPNFFIFVNFNIGNACIIKVVTGCRVSTLVKFIYSEKATKFCKIFTLLLTGTTQDKSKVKILQNFVAFSEYMNFSRARGQLPENRGLLHYQVKFIFSPPQICPRQ